MLNRIAPVAPPRIELPDPAPSRAAGHGDAFSKVFKDAIDRVESYRVDAERSIDRFLAGEQEDVHKVALAAQQAELALETFLQMKNKVVQAYQEVMRMQL
jgi:flagellar hook-basal body complex protein FliE